MNVDSSWDGGNSVVLLSCTLAFFVTAFGRLALSPLVPQITADFGLSNAEIGIALSGMWAAYSLTQYPSGVLADRYGERAIVLTALGGTGLMSLVVAVAPIYTVFLVGAVLLGAVGGLHYSAATALLSRTYENTGMAIGVHNIGMPAGGLIAPVAASWVGVRYGWRPAAILVLATAIPVLALFASTVRSRTVPVRTESLRDGFTPESLGALRSSPSVAFTVCLGSVSMFVAIGLFTFVPTFLVEYAGYPTAIAGAIFAAFFGLLILLQAVIGYVSDVYGRDRTLTGCFVACCAGLLLLLVSSNPASLAVSMGLIALGSSTVPVIDSRLVDQSTEDDIGAEFGLPRAIYGLLGGSGAVVVGTLADLFDWTVSFGFLAGISLLVAIAICLNEYFSLGY
ncbi:MFS transporter [Natronorubrum sp. FCH18a]|uniref:MFS transporter n=1 Tax=Natronorubrum sp. FCH18a TaxID=3447018 RepID=UPI003F519F25